MTVIQIFIALLMGLLVGLSTSFYMTIRCAKPRSNEGSR